VKREKKGKGGKRRMKISYTYMRFGRSLMGATSRENEMKKEHIYC
jgi:hypothetical protein